MKKIRNIYLFIVLLILLLPIIFFNTETDSISKIDNRKLTENPFELSELSTSLNQKVFPNLENYVKDRIGFRDNMIEYYTLFNDNFFRKMVHPSYSYGKDGYVFGAGITTNEEYNEFHEAFVDTIYKLQDYSESRNVPFLFVFNPAKPSIYPEKIQTGINYNRGWVEKFMLDLQEKNINFVDNTVTLMNAKNNDETVFNKKYDANHWNYIGAYWGVNEILQNMNKVNNNIIPNTLDDFNLEYETKTSLPVSNFKIKEDVPLMTLKSNILDITEEYSDEIMIDEQYRYFKYTINPEKLEQNSPRVLVFQGSYMNNFGKLFLQNSFGEYIAVHDYQNILNLPYYFNIFNPDYVVFEVAEYTLTDNYFNFEKMKNLNFNKKFELVHSRTMNSTENELSMSDIYIEQGKSLTTIVWNNKMGDIAWLFLDKEYDLIKNEDKNYFLSIPNDIYNNYKENLYITSYNKDENSINYFR